MIMTLHKLIYFIHITEIENISILEIRFYEGGEIYHEQTFENYYFIPK